MGQNMKRILLSLILISTTFLSASIEDQIKAKEEQLEQLGNKIFEMSQNINKMKKEINKFRLKSIFEIKKTKEKESNNEVSDDYLEEILNQQSIDFFNAFINTERTEPVIGNDKFFEELKEEASILKFLIIKCMMDTAKLNKLLVLYENITKEIIVLNT